MSYPGEMARQAERVVAVSGGEVYSVTKIPAPRVLRI